MLEERRRRLRSLLETKFSPAVDDVVRDQDAEILVTPVRAPRANAYAERWIPTVRAECPDWLLMLGAATSNRSLGFISGTTTSTLRTEQWD